MRFQLTRRESVGYVYRRRALAACGRQSVYTLEQSRLGAGIEAGRRFTEVSSSYDSGGNLLEDDEISLVAPEKRSSQCDPLPLTTAEACALVLLV